MHEKKKPDSGESVAQGGKGESIDADQTLMGHINLSYADQWMEQFALLLAQRGEETKKGTWCKVIAFC